MIEEFCGRKRLKIIPSHVICSLFAGITDNTECSVEICVSAYAASQWHVHSALIYTERTMSPWNAYTASGAFRPGCLLLCV